MMTHSRFIRTLSGVGLISLLLITSSLWGLCAPRIHQDEVLRSIRIGSRHAREVLLHPKGFARGDYDTAKKVWKEYEPAWHTGQLILALLEANKVNHEPENLADARRAGDWWRSLEIRNGKLKGFLAAVHGDYLPDDILFATVSDGAPGLYVLSERSGDKRYADVATQAARWMRDNLAVEDTGLYYDFIHLKTGEIKRSSPGVPIEKVARPNIEGSIFRLAYRHSGDPKFREAFRRQCDVTTARQDERGLWMEFSPNDGESGYVHPRFNVWNAEALLECYEEFGEEKFLMAAVKTAETYAEAQQSDGSLQFYDHSGRGSVKDAQSGSAFAFAGILWIRVDQIRKTNRFSDHIDRAVHWVLEHQYPEDHPDSNLAGAFRDLKTRKVGGRPVHLQRDLGTAFSLRFLSEYHRSRWSK